MDWLELSSIFAMQQTRKENVNFSSNLYHLHSLHSVLFLFHLPTMFDKQAIALIPNIFSAKSQE